MSLRSRVIILGMIFALALPLLTGPLAALCGACQSNLDVLACYSDASATIGCKTYKCWVEGDQIGKVQWGTCCTDDFSCQA